MRKTGLFCTILAIFIATDVVAEQCKLLSDAEYTKMYTGHTVSVQYAVREDDHLESSQADIFFLKNGCYSTTWYQYLDHIEYMRFNFKGNWTIQNAVLSMKISECNHTITQDPLENKNADEFCQDLTHFDPVKINPCNPFSWEGWGY